MESLRFDRLCINAKSRSRGGHNSSGSLQRDARRNVASSYDRFRRSLSSFVFSLNYTEHITDTHNRNIIEMLLHNPMSQAELVHDINEKGYTHDIAVAVAFSCRLKCFDEINYSVCQKLSGLYLFSVVKFERESLVNFLRRCPNIKSLTLAYMDLIDADFLCAIFSDGLLPKLEFLEITYASDDAIAAMVSAPYLRKIVFQFPDRCITNDGFKRLVEAGGGKNLDAITVRILFTVVCCKSTDDRLTYLSNFFPYRLVWTEPIPQRHSLKVS